MQTCNTPNTYLFVRAFEITLGYIRYREWNNTRCLTHTDENGQNFIHKKTMCMHSINMMVDLSSSQLPQSFHSLLFTLSGKQKFFVSLLSNTQNACYSSFFFDTMKGTILIQHYAMSACRWQRSIECIPFFFSLLSWNYISPLHRVHFAMGSRARERARLPEKESQWVSVW